MLAADTRAAEQRHARARRERRVVFTPVEDGMTELWALLPAEQAAGLKARLDHCVEQSAGQDNRTADQRRADALCAAESAAGNGAAVQVTVALSTLLGLDDHLAELDGHGPVPATVARALAFDPTSTWRRLLVDERGSLLDVGRRTYRPPMAIARHVRMQHRTCTFPGCRQAARRCELDHRVAWRDGGVTSAFNLHPLCVRHHHLKHETRWRVHRTCDGGSRWVSPTARVYDRAPVPLPIDTTLVTASGDPPPF